MSDMLTRSMLKQMERTRVRRGGKKVVTDDIAKLKGLRQSPELPEEDLNNFYVEPVLIEYYIPKESRFANETKFMYIELIDPEPRSDIQREVMQSFKEDEAPIDVLEAMDRFPDYMDVIMDFYQSTLSLHERVSLLYQSRFIDEMAIRRALYINEVLLKREPTVPALKFLGDFITYNINWCIRFLNEKKIEVTLEDLTVEYLIKRYRRALAERGETTSERFEILAQIYLDQAFPLSEEEFMEDEDFD